MIKITLKRLPPTVNHYKQRARNGGEYLSEQVHVFRREVWAALREIGAQTAPAGDLEVVITFQPGDKRKRDVDNVVKATFDALAHALSFDDSQVARLVAERLAPVRGKPLTEITIQPYHSQ